MSSNDATLKKIFKHFSTGFIVVFSCTAMASENYFDDGTGLDKWLELEVFSTTKTLMPIVKSPGAVRVYTEADFKRFNLKTLKDMLTLLPGIQLVKSYKNHTSMWVRGIQTRYNSKLLLLIDGVPIRENYYGHFDIDQGLGLGNVQQVEIINGPGSVLYGANAFAGVISITTKNAGRSIAAQAHAQEGFGYHDAAPELTGEAAHRDRSYGRKISLEADADWGESKRLYAFAQVGEGDAFNPRRDHEEGNPYQHRLDEEKQLLMGKLRIDDFTLSVTDNKTNIPDVYAKHFKDYQHIHRPRYISLTYNSSILYTEGLSGLVWYQDYAYDETKTEYLDDGSGQLDEFQEAFIHSRMYGVNLDYTQRFGADHEVTGGFALLHDESIDRIREHDNDGTGWSEWEYALNENITRDTRGVFVQDNWSLNNSLNLISGLRYDNLSDFDDQFSYRIGLTGLGEDGLFGKLLVGSAYRTPNYREYGKEGVENHAIQPEQLLTTELQIGKLFPRSDIDVTLYYNIYNDFINDILVPEDGISCDDSDQYYSNFKRREVLGVEFNSVYYPGNDLVLVLAAHKILDATEENGPLPTDAIDRGGSCDSGGYQSDKKDIDLLSEFILSLAASYQFNDKYQGGFKLQYASKRSVPQNYHENLSAELRSDSADHPDAYYLLDLFLNINWGKNISLNIDIDNLTDEEIYFPRLSDLRDYGVEYPGRRVSVSFKYDF